MPTLQVEEYYLCIPHLELTDSEKGAIEDILDNEGYSSYEFQDGDSFLIVDDIPDESTGDNLEDEIQKIISGE